MRGKGDGTAIPRSSMGITPAYAGKRRGWSKWQISSRGSPPRMRGKERSCHSHQCVHGITPAYAGKRNGRCSCSTAGRDHPRVCGEKPRRRSSGRTWPGSPPRVRGKGVATAIWIVAMRITPACAGKSGNKNGNRIRDWDHPRVCGEKLGKRDLLGHGQGSPPRVRGKVGLICSGGLAVGITPACAGKRRSRCLHRSARWDHPRVCGEKGDKANGGVCTEGSPPRVRGKGEGVPDIRSIPGITPACAGKRPECKRRVRA